MPKSIPNWLAGDKRYFKDHPGTRYRIRKTAQGERSVNFGNIISPAGQADRLTRAAQAAADVKAPEPGHTAVTLVHLVSSKFRQRKFTSLPDELFELRGHFDQDTLETFFDDGFLPFGPELLALLDD